MREVIHNTWIRSLLEGSVHTHLINDGRVNAEARLHILAQFREFPLPFKIQFFIT